MNDILTVDKRLTLFEDGVVIDKKLLKWRNAERGMSKTQIPNSTTNNVVLSHPDELTNDNLSWYLNNRNNIVSGDIDSNINNLPVWVDLYEFADGVSFDKLALLGVQELNRLLVEDKLKYVIGGYGAFGNTQRRRSIITYNTTNEGSGFNPTNIFSKICDWVYNKYQTYKEKKSVDFDALEFFKIVKLTTSNSITTYRNRVQDYLIAIHNAVVSGQTALIEELARGMITNKYEAVLESEGFYKAITEEQLVSFLLKCEKGIKLDYIKNFTRPLPNDIVQKIDIMNQLEIFDNYVILYYDKDGKIYKETAKEKAKRKDPILFGVIAGSNKLYYIADWEDEYCDLTLEKFLDIAQLTKSDIKLNDKVVLPIEVEQTKKKKYKKRKPKTKKEISE